MKLFELLEDTSLDFSLALKKRGYRPAKPDGGYKPFLRRYVVGGLARIEEVLLAPGGEWSVRFGPEGVEGPEIQRGHKLSALLRYLDSPEHKRQAGAAEHFQVTASPGPDVFAPQF